MHNERTLCAHNDKDIIEKEIMLATDNENAFRFKGTPLHWEHGQWRLLG